jgi:hypothetical protein
MRARASRQATQAPAHVRVRVLRELKALLDSFPPEVRRRLMAELRSVWVRVAPERSARRAG